MGEEGFSSDCSLLYHRGLPSAIVASEVWELPDQTRTPNHPLKPRHLKLHALETGGDAVTDRRLVLGNNDVRIGYVVTGTEPSPYYRNAIGDECVYVESGAGAVETVFGVIGYRAGDYVIVPRATTHPRAPRGGCRGRPRRGGCRPRGASSTRSRPTATWLRRSATCPATASCSSTRRTASVTSTDPSSRSPWPARTSRCWSSTAPAPASSAPGSPTRRTRSTWSAGTAASTRTRSTSRTTCRSPARCTSHRRSTRCSRVTT